MNQLLVASLIFLSVFSGCSEKKASPSKFNLDFEKAENGIPLGWTNFGSPDYTISLDSTCVKSGKYSARIALNAGSPNFKAWSFGIPHNYAGKSISLSGYIKTENVTQGYGGLWMRIDPNIAFDNMSNNGVQGTTDW